MNGNCESTYTDERGWTHACTLPAGHEEAHNENDHFYWAHWASDGREI